MVLASLAVSPLFPEGETFLVAKDVVVLDQTGTDGGTQGPTIGVQHAMLFVMLFWGAFSLLILFIACKLIGLLG